MIYENKNGLLVPIEKVFNKFEGGGVKEITNIYDYKKNNELVKTFSGEITKWLIRDNINVNWNNDAINKFGLSCVDISFNGNNITYSSASGSSVRGWTSSILTIVNADLFSKYDLYAKGTISIIMTGGFRWDAGTIMFGDYYQATGDRFLQRIENTIAHDEFYKCNNAKDNCILAGSHHWSDYSYNQTVSITMTNMSVYIGRKK